MLKPFWQRLSITLLTGIVLLSASATLSAAQVTAAVAANFTVPMKAISKAFANHTGHTTRLSFGSSGQLLAQIQHGAPFEVFLSADTAKPARLIADGQAVPESVFTYAIGQIVLWSAQPNRVEDGRARLAAGDFQRLAIANPRLAPYGEAAVTTLKNLALYAALKPKLVQGGNIAQTYQFVSTGNAQLGFVALSQVIANGTIGTGSGWLVPDKLHPPIRQDAVLLQNGADNPAATALLEFLQGPQAKTIIERYGYATANQ